MSYINIIKTACLFFPLLALVITIPFILRQYHKYGAIPILRVLIVYSFTLYLLIAYFLIILPLPTITEVNNMTGPIVNFMPFAFVSDILEAKSIFSAQFYTVLFNLVLTIPFGVYLRYYFKQDLKHTLLYSFLLSLFFEITQITGLYFIYPRPYRLFDVDDLIINTLGGVIGYFMTKLFTFFLPTRDELDHISYKKGLKVSFIRRSMAYFLDIFFMSILYSIVYSILSSFNLNYFNIMAILVTLFLYYPIYMSLKKGQTIGKKIVNIRVVKINDEAAKVYNYFIRYLLLYAGMIIIPYLIILLVATCFKMLEPMAFVIVMCMLMFVFILIVFYIVLNNIIKKKLFLYEKISRTKNVSTIDYQIDEEKNK